MNGLADSVVEYMPRNAEAWSVQPRPCSVWANDYPVAQIKLLYLIFLPQHMQHAYPRANEGNTAIAATPPSKIKRGCQQPW